MSLSIHSWKYLWLFLITTHSQLNQWTKSTNEYGEEIWHSTSDFIPVRSQSFGTIRIGRTMTAEFDFQFGGRTNDPKPDVYEMFFRVGFDSNLGNGCSGQGSRYPSFWLASGSDTLHVSVSDNNSCQPSYSLAAYGIITIGVWYHVIISYDASSLYVEVSGGGQAPWSQSWPRDDTIREHLGEEASIWWMSGKFGPTEYNRGNGTFSNITISSADFQYTPTPTTDPTVNPTEPTPFPTAVATPTLTPTVLPTLNPVPPIPSLPPTSTPTAIPTAVPSVSTVDFSPTSIPTPEPTEGFVLSVIATTTMPPSIAMIPSGFTSQSVPEVTGIVAKQPQQEVVWGDPLSSIDMATVVWSAVIASCVCCSIAVVIVWITFKRQFKGMKAELQAHDTNSSHSTMVIRRVATESGRRPSASGQDLVSRDLLAQIEYLDRKADGELKQISHEDHEQNGQNQRNERSDRNRSDRNRVHRHKAVHKSHFQRVGGGMRYSDDLQNGSHSDMDQFEEYDDMGAGPELTPSPKGHSEIDSEDHEDHEEDGMSVLNALGIHVSPRHNWPMRIHAQQIELRENSDDSEENLEDLEPLEPRDVPRVVSTDNMKNHEFAEGFGST